MGQCFRLWGFLRGTVRVVSGVTEDRHRTRGHVDDVGLAERVLSIAQEKNISLGDDRRRRRWRRSGGCRWFHGFGDPFHRWWRGHSQLVLVVGSIWPVNVLQVPHLLVDHPQLIGLIKLKNEKKSDVNICHHVSASYETGRNSVFLLKTLNFLL